MSKLLKSVALHSNLNEEYNVLMKWNDKQEDQPLNLFNHLWLSLKSVNNSEYVIEVAERIKNELGTKYSLIVYNTLALYDNKYAKLALADIYSHGDGVTKDLTMAEEYYKECLEDSLLTPLVAARLDVIHCQEDLLHL